MDKREIIEELLTIALEPEYKRWDLKNKINDLEKVFKKEDVSHQNDKSNHHVELEDSDFYDELDKDDMLDRLGQHKPIGRKYSEKFEELSINYGADSILTVNLGADDPIDLESKEALKFAANIAGRKGYSIFYQIEDDIRLYGQNCLAERMFFFQK